MWMASMPVPDAAPLSRVHPPTSNAEVTVAPSAGVSTVSARNDASLTSA